MARDTTTSVARRAKLAADSRRAVFRWLRPARGFDELDACDFIAGNPHEMALPGYVAAIQRALVPDSPSYYAYGPPWPPATEAVTRALASRLDLALDPENVFLTRGASAGLWAVLRAVVESGDEVVMMSPPWFFYESMVLALEAIPVKVPLTNAEMDLDLPAIERAITSRTRVVIVNTPHNPSGRIYPENQLRGLSALLEQASIRIGRTIYLASDEAYARILFDGRAMITPARYYDPTFMLHTYSKTLLAPSQRAGYLAFTAAMPEPEPLREALFGELMLGGGIPDTAMQHAMPELEELCIDVKAIERRRDRLVAELRKLGYLLHVPEAGFYLFPRSPIPDASEFVDWLAERKVFALPGEAFERPGWFRLSLTATDEMVDRALPIFAEAMERLGSISHAEGSIP
jgi:aspartate aminotransferase